jgi:membrane protease YdiL (CAAX protease family)
MYSRAWFIARARTMVRTRHLLGLFVAFAATLGAFAALQRVRAWLGPGLPLDARLVGSFVLLAPTVLGAAAWRFIAGEAALVRLRARRPGPQLVFLLFTVAIALSAAAFAATSAHEWPRWSHWQVPIASWTGVQEMAGIWMRVVREELVYRYILMGTFIAWCRSPVLALIVTTTLFTLGHPGRDAAFIAAGGTWFGLVALRSGSLWPAVAAHFAANVALQMLNSSSPLSHPALLDPGVRTTFHQAFLVLMCGAAAALAVPLLQRDPLVRVVKAQWARLRQRTSTG